MAGLRGCEFLGRGLAMDRALELISVDHRRGDFEWECMCGTVGKGDQAH